jgi:hypothetical protein
MIRTEIKVETMVNEIKKTEDNVISTLGDIKRAVSDFTDIFSRYKREHNGRDVKERQRDQKERR